MPTLRSIRYRRTLLACIGIMSSISAQNITSDFPASDTLSTACRDSINNLINGEFGKCSKISDLIQFAYSNNSNPLSRYSNYVKNFCEAEVCSSEILSKTVKSLRSTCLSDLKTGNIDVIRTYATSSQYSLLRNSLCLRRVSDSTLCLTSMLDELQVFGKVPFSVSQIENVVIGGFPSIISSLDNLPEKFCNDCIHGLITVLPSTTANGDAALPPVAKGLPDGVKIQAHPILQNAQPATMTIAALCGASVIDGKIPPSLVTGLGSRPAANASFVSKTSDASRTTFYTSNCKRLACSAAYITFIVSLFI